MVRTLSQRRRAQLKHTLASKRQILSRQESGRSIFLPECAYCGKGINGSPDMHEVLFTKGDVSTEEQKVLITNACNCVLVHPGGNTSACHSGIQSQQGQEIAIQHLRKWEGTDKLVQYVFMMSDHMKGSQCEAAYYLVKGGA